jgi:hypothetical protein
MASEPILDFLEAVDEELARHAEEGEVLDLHLLGRSALILGYGLRLMTKDVDVVDVTGSRLFDLALAVFGKDGTGRRVGGFYLESVSSGLPPLPPGYQVRCVAVVGPWSVIRPKRPEAHDLVVTKLRRFHQGDREDIRILCDTAELSPETLREGSRGHDAARPGARGGGSATSDVDRGRDRGIGRYEGAGSRPIWAMDPGGVPTGDIMPSS